MRFTRRWRITVPRRGRIRAAEPAARAGVACSSGRATGRCWRASNGRSCRACKRQRQERPHQPATRRIGSARRSSTDASRIDSSPRVSSISRRRAPARAAGRCAGRVAPSVTWRCDISAGACGGAPCAGRGAAGRARRRGGRLSSRVARQRRLRKRQRADIIPPGAAWGARKAIAWRIHGPAWRAAYTSADECPGHRILVRRNRRRPRGVRPGPSGRACSRRRCTARSRCTRSTAAWCPNWRRATTSGASCRCARQVLAEAGATLGAIDVVAYTRGPGLAGALLVGAGVACALGRGARQAGARRAPPRRPPAVAVPVGRSAGLPVRRAAGLRRPHAADAGRRRRPLRAARRDHRRCRRRSLRQVGQAARPRLSGRPGAGAAGRVRRRRAPSRCRGRCCTAATSTSPSPA